MQFDNIPFELRNVPQWVMWRYEETDGEKPTKVPYQITGKHASVTDKSTWSTFMECKAAFISGGFDGIGFVFTDNDPFAFIDLDDYKGDKSIYERQLRIFKEFDSYSEVSPSGTGLHVIIKGAIPSGKKRSRIEVYSSKRFATMTGNVFHDHIIEDRQAIFYTLWEQMGGDVTTQGSHHGNAIEKYSDDEVIAKALSAVNGDKFTILLNGEWRDLYPTQSEADFAFIDIVAFYSENATQVTRIFRTSRLGQRAKASRDDYVERMVNNAFDRMLPQIDIDGLRNQLEFAMANSQPSAPNSTVQIEMFPGIKALSPHIGDVPPGLIGDIAKFIFAASPRPVTEIALTGAIGLLAGIVGRAYNVSGTGLNHYVLLVSSTGTGKEAMAMGIDKLMASIRMQVPSASMFLGPGKINSDAALIKYISKKSQCFVSVIGEFGLVMEDLNARNQNSSQRGLQRILLDLYNKSGPNQILYPSIYSESEKSTDNVVSPCFSILGETTPDTFYGALDEKLIKRGVLPRFLIIEYNGPRVPQNKNHDKVMPTFQLSEQLAALCGHCLTLMHKQAVCTVALDKDAEEIIDSFDKYCDDIINNPNSQEVLKHLWTRAHVKIMKLAALVAIGVNPFQPVVTLPIAQWAMAIVQADTRSLSHRFERGDIGKDSEETKQIIKVVKAMAQYIHCDYSKVATYGVKPAMHNDKVIPSSFIQRRLTSDSTFREDKMGATIAIKRCLQTLVENGDIREVGKNDLAVKYGFSGRAFMVVNVGVIMQ